MDKIHTIEIEKNTLFQLKYQQIHTSQCIFRTIVAFVWILNNSIELFFREGFQSLFELRILMRIQQRGIDDVAMYQLQIFQIRIQTVPDQNRLVGEHIQKFPMDIFQSGRAHAHYFLVDTRKLFIIFNYGVGRFHVRFISYITIRIDDRDFGRFHSLSRIGHFAIYSENLMVFRIYATRFRLDEPLEVLVIHIFVDMASCLAATGGKLISITAWI